MASSEDKKYKRKPFSKRTSTNLPTELAVICQKQGRHILRGFSTESSFVAVKVKVRVTTIYFSVEI